MMRHILFNRRTAAAAAAAGAVAAAIFVGIAQGAGPASPPPPGGPEHYSIALFGDMPYGALGRSQYPNLIADVNASHIKFSIHDGDLQAGGDGPCTNDLYTRSLAYFQSFEQPVVFTTGDNDWTDCWGRYGPAQQPYQDPIERLDYERQLFFSMPKSLGRHPMTLTRESSEGGQYSIYSENQRWVVGPVVYLTVNVQGSNDNYPYEDTDTENPSAPPRSDAERDRQRAEEVARKAADLHWLQEGFDYAKQIGAKGILIDWQADPNFNNEMHQTNPHEWDAFPDYVNALRTLTEAYSGQVVLVHGDSHYFKLDKPLNRSSGGGVLTNFTRVETFGARNTHWVLATIDPNDPNLFEFSPRIVAANAG